MWLNTLLREVEENCVMFVWKKLTEEHLLDLMQGDEHIKHVTSTLA